jgi:DNA-directed RNA polymerase subunit RPC12/RpoP
MRELPPFQDESTPPPLVPITADDPDSPLDLKRRDVHTLEAGRTFDEGEGRIFPCENCGADLEFHIGAQSLKCNYCGHVKELQHKDEEALAEQDFHAMLQKLQEWREASQQKTDDASGSGESSDPAATIQEIRCESCGGNVEFLGTLTSTHCPYCSAAVQLEKAHKSNERRIPVDGVLPFQIDREHARKNLGQWVSSRWFAPNRFLKQGAEGKFNGIYLSYFTYDSMTFTSYSGSRGEYYYVTVGSGKEQRTERRTRWYPASGSFQRFFDDILVLANTGLRRDFMLALEPWPLLKVVPFDQQMLAGFLARTYDLDLDHCFQEAKDGIDAALHTEVRQRIGGDTQSIDSINSRHDAITFKHLLLPAWLMAYRYGTTSYQVFINAATGEVQGERPYSVWKISFAVLLGSALAAGIYYWQQQR